MPGTNHARPLCRAVFPLLLLAARLLAQPVEPPIGVVRGATTAAGRRAAEADTLRLYYLGYPIGRETYELVPSADGFTLSSDFDYVDRGRRTHLQGRMRVARDYSPRHLEVVRLTDSSRTVVTRVDVEGRRAEQVRGEAATSFDLPPIAFAISPYAPVSQHLALLRYWLSHGMPPTLAIVPGGPTNTVRIARSGRDTVTVGTRRVALERFAIDGVVWGIEYVWLDAGGRLVAFTTAGGGGLSLEAIRSEVEPAYPELMRRAAAASIADLERISRRARAVAGGTVALVGATLVDGTGAAPVPNATVVVADGRIVAAGAAEHVAIPAGARRVDVRGKTIVPGLWDMHTHLNQIEWAPVYLAAGVTTVRDMGNEVPFITALRRSVQAGRTVGPRMLLAGLVDGGGPNAFGAVQAETPDEGVGAVRLYHGLGFEQMKLYSLLKPEVVAAICREAHRLGMTVTGHVPTALSLLAAVDSGMDHIAHLPIRGDPASDSVRHIIAVLKERGTVIDPTASWGELLGHSTTVPVASFQPVIDRLPPVLAQRITAMGTANIDAAAANGRLDRTLSIIGALYRAGVPIVAGTDEGIPGFSVYREIELYAKAGMSPMDALRSATAVPAKAMGIEAELGTIEAGKRADLVVLDANPLDDISNIRSVRLVMTGGRLYASAALWRSVGFKP